MIPVVRFGSKQAAPSIIGFSADIGKFRSELGTIVWDLRDVQNGDYQITAYSIDRAESFGLKKKTFNIRITDELSGPKSYIIRNRQGRTFKTSESPLINESRNENSRPLIRRFAASSTVIKGCAKECQVEIFIDSIDPDDDPIYEKFEISDGRLVFNKNKVIWILNGVEPGNHEIRVCPDDGSGCGNASDWKRIRIVVKE